ncbi:MAG TPA: hypothetical protein PK874_06335 [Desulfobacteraceae bacterium]|nr:hypothetical protein [Desulfobacteraceae bacterium]HPJ66646.1 hypothetical protein [Desulfobacteraceae bacterium]HPQ27765.1 hypothetical protein [Desulfobacteraceae bacterium]
MKRSTKVLSIVLIVSFCVGAAVVAVGGVYNGVHSLCRFKAIAHKVFTAERIIPRLKECLNLTGEQEKQLRPIIDSHREKRMAMFEKRKEMVLNGLQEMRTEREALWQELEQQLSTVLTEDQMQKAREIHEEYVNVRHSFARMMFKTGGELHQIFEDLDLSGEQIESIITIFRKYRDTRWEAVDEFVETKKQIIDMMLNEEFNKEKVRQTYREATARFEDFVVEKAEMLAEMKAVLNPEQLGLLQEKIPALMAELQENIQARRTMFDSLPCR